MMLVLFTAVKPGRILSFSENGYISEASQCRSLCFSARESNLEPKKRKEVNHEQATH